MKKRDLIDPDSRGIIPIQFRVNPAKQEKLACKSLKIITEWSDYTISENKGMGLTFHLANCAGEAIAREFARTRKEGLTPLFQFRL